MNINSRQRGFTIVELLIVIVVIGILAAITIVAYNGIQARASDSRIKAAADQVSKAAYLFNSYTGSPPTATGWGATVSGTGCAGGAGGWAAAGMYDCPFEGILKNQKLLPDNFIYNLPGNKQLGVTNGTQTMMVYPCGTNKLILMWYLASPSSTDISSNASNMSTCGYTVSDFSTNYGMKSSTLLQF